MPELLVMDLNKEKNPSERSEGFIINIGIRKKKSLAKANVCGILNGIVYL